MYSYYIHFEVQGEFIIIVITSYFTLKLILLFSYFLAHWSIPIMVKYGNAPFGLRNAGFSYCGTMKNITGPSWGEFNCNGATARYVLIQRFYERRENVLTLCQVKVIGRGMSYFYLMKKLFTLRLLDNLPLPCGTSSCGVHP